MAMENNATLMEAEIMSKDQWELAIHWQKEDVGFGMLTMKWDKERQVFILDSELMGTDTVIEIFKALKPDDHLFAA